MRIGVLEWASCGGVIDLASLPESIRREGWAMCRALIESVRMGGHEPVACLMPDLLRDTASTNMWAVDPSKDIRAQWRAAYGGCELVIVVAPESDGVLLELEAWCASNGCRSTNSAAEFIQFAGDKWLTAQCLRQAGVLHPRTCLLSDWRFDEAVQSGADRWVVKARDGAGCDGMQLLASEELVQLQSQRANGDRWIVQPWINGRALSRSAVVDAQGNCHWLPVVEQHLSVSTTISYQGGSVSAEHRLTDSQMHQLDQAIIALPGRPRGWIGIDFLIDANGQLTVIEINPRLTTSFVGLAQACEPSLADVLVRAVLGQAVQLPEQWRAIEFNAGG